MDIGFIGLGAMGLPMARNLHKAGLLVGVWNRTRSQAEALAGETGVAVAADPGELARRCDVVFTCVSADEDLAAVIDALLPGLSAGSTVVDTSTVSQAAARDAARRLAGVGADFLDAPMSGGVEGARQGTLAMMVGGDAGVLERVRPALDALSGRIAHMGPVGAGQAAKAVNQVMVAGINQAVSEALAFAEALGLPMDRVIETTSAGAAGNWFLSHRGATMTSGHFEPGFKVALHRKDLTICRDMAQAYGVSLPMVEMTLVHYRRLCDAGYGDEDISALFREKQKLFKTGSK